MKHVPAWTMHLLIPEGYSICLAIVDLLTVSIVNHIRFPSALSLAREYEQGSYLLWVPEFLLTIHLVLIHILPLRPFFDTYPISSSSLRSCKIRSKAYHSLNGFAPRLCFTGDQTRFSVRKK